MRQYELAPRTDTDSNKNQSVVDEKEEEFQDEFQEECSPPPEPAHNRVCVVVAFCAILWIVLLVLVFNSGNMLDARYDSTAEIDEFVYDLLVYRATPAGTKQRLHILYITTKK